MKKNNTQNIRCFVNEAMVPLTQRLILKIVGFQVYACFCLLFFPMGCIFYDVVAQYNARTYHAHRVSRIGRGLTSEWYHTHQQGLTNHRILSRLCPTFHDLLQTGLQVKLDQIFCEDTSRPLGLTPTLQNFHYFSFHLQDLLHNLR